MILGKPELMKHSFAKRFLLTPQELKEGMIDRVKSGINFNRSE